jgi:hypothetical protein
VNLPQKQNDFIHLEVYFTCKQNNFTSQDAASPHQQNNFVDYKMMFVYSDAIFPRKQNYFA